MNGQRLAGAEGSNATDITLIPIVAVERIEITTSGAGALYGSDAVADCARQREINAQDRAYIPASISGTTLMPSMQYCSALLSSAGRLPGGFEFGVLGAYTSRSVYQAQNLAFLETDATASTRSNVAVYAFDASLERRLLGSWTATVSASLSADDAAGPELLTETGFPDQHAGDLFDNRLWSGQLVVSGTLVGTRAGDVELTLGTGYH